MWPAFIDSDLADAFDLNVARVSGVGSAGVAVAGVLFASHRMEAVERADRFLFTHIISQPASHKLARFVTTCKIK